MTKKKSDSTDEGHGTLWKYGRGCRCVKCVDRKHAELDATLPRHPKCFESREQWIAWCELAEASRISKANFCMDCTPHYKRLMDAAGLCEYPATEFEWSDDENDWVVKLTIDELRQRSAVDWFERCAETVAAQEKV